jgi:predicted nucleic acid-binding protein
MAGLGSVLRDYRAIGLDTSIFIYQFENAAPYADLTNAVFEELEGAHIMGVTSIVTLMELIVRPLQLGRADIAHEYETELLHFPNLRTADIDRGIVWKAAELRATHRLQPADALQIATCLQHGGQTFLTNDRILQRVSDLPILLLSDFL